MPGVYDNPVPWPDAAEKVGTPEVTVETSVQPPEIVDSKKSGVTPTIPDIENPFELV